MKDKIIEILIAFLDQIREYELEAGHSIAQDERETKEFIDIFLNEDYKEDRPDCLEQLLSEPKASGMSDDQRSAEEWLEENSSDYGFIDGMSVYSSYKTIKKKLIEMMDQFASTRRKKEKEEWVSVDACQFESGDGTSATICKHCGREKWQHLPSTT